MKLMCLSLSQIALFLIKAWENPKIFYPELPLYAAAWKERTGHEVTVGEMDIIEKVYSRRLP